MPNGKEMNETDLPGSGKIKVGEKFCINKTKFFKVNGGHQKAGNKKTIIQIHGSGPFLLLGINFFSQDRQSLYFFRFIDNSGKERMVNKKYCF